MKNRRVLFVSPVRESLDIKLRPHLGLGLLATKLKQANFEVKILDYIIDRDLPNVREVIESYQPGIVGITTNTATWKQADEYLETLQEFPEIKTLVGGPHATLYSEDLQKDRRIHYLFRGESEESIVQICESEGLPQTTVVSCPARPEAADIPFPSFECCFNHEKIQAYPIQTSRGCPYSCTFCEVSEIASKKWRRRPVDHIIEELKIAVKKHPGVKLINVVDDAPGLLKSHFKEFLDRYAGIKGSLELRVDNIRADSIDEEMVRLLAKANCISVCLGVEHGNPEVFESIKKGETQDDIRRAARLLKEGSLRLGMCFVIGLPGDSFERTKDSVQFAKQNGAEYMFWNILVPHKGTEVRDWIEQHGTIGDESNFSSSIDDQIYNDEVTFETPDFSKEEIARAHFWAVLSTNNYILQRKNFLYVLFHSLRYGFIREFLNSLFIQFRRKYAHRFPLLRRLYRMFKARPAAS